MITKPKKLRIDELLLETGFAESIERARALVMAGDVLVDDVPVTKAGELVAVDGEIRIRGERIPYVSRGGLKLAAALDGFRIGVAGKICMDVGASTGGFTDCLLQRDAAKVYAIDVGYGQLSQRIANDERVTVIDRTNIRSIDPALVPDRIDIAVVDVSFISLELVLPQVQKFLADEAIVVALVKPQFELPQEFVGEGGIVRDSSSHAKAVDNVTSIGDGLGWKCEGSIESPIKGAKGNTEFLICFRKF